PLPDALPICGAGGPVCRVRVGGTGSKNHAAVPSHGDSEADRPLENAGPRQGRPLNPQPPMQRRFGLLHATALNMTNMIGIGPFITIPLLMSALGGPQAMLGWVVALAIIGLVNLALLYRRITSIATITVALWVGTMVTVLVVVVTGARHFDARVAFDFPPGAFAFSLGFLIGLGGAARIGVYDYLGYYD